LTKPFRYVTIYRNKIQGEFIIMFHRPFFPFERHSRIFEKGALKYVILDLVKDKPSHGYEIIRAMEDYFHGFYTPSAGSVYPTLQMLDDMGYVKSSEHDGKKVYTITPEGREFLKKEQEVIEKIKGQMEEWWHPRNTSEFHDTIHELRSLGRIVGHRAHNINPEKWTKIKDIVIKAHRDIENVLNKE
jgi:DNA-binding PadR family transcriptional regulator